MTTKIEWVRNPDGTKGETWNPASGCTKVSEGCAHCFIDRTPPFRMRGIRFDGPNGHDAIGATTGVTLHSDRLGRPQSWRKPRRVFVNSLCDLFHDAIPDRFIAEVFAVMSLCPAHVFEVLTKRPGRMASLLSDGHGAATQEFERLVVEGRRARGFDGAHEWPLPNVWLGVSAENQHWADVRIPKLLETPAAKRFISCEPLLGPVDLTASIPLEFGIDWIIAGGETGPNARPVHPDWVRSLRDQCVAARVSFFFKQRGEWTWDAPERGPEKRVLWNDGRSFGQPYPAPRSGDQDRPYFVWRVGKKAAGRELDGQTHDGMPT